YTLLIAFLWYALCVVRVKGKTNPAFGLAARRLLPIPPAALPPVGAANLWLRRRQCALWARTRLRCRRLGCRWLWGPTMDVWVPCCWLRRRWRTRCSGRWRRWRRSSWRRLVRARSIKDATSCARGQLLTRRVGRRHARSRRSVVASQTAVTILRRDFALLGACTAFSTADGALDTKRGVANNADVCADRATAVVCRLCTHRC
ncbi:hypothetical protein SPRG_04638, partial [Saprolegnia parasitica CBS 223.65]